MISKIGIGGSCMNFNIQVKWSGNWPALCHGTWSIKVDDVNIPIPENKISSDMGTYGTYQT